MSHMRKYLISAGAFTLLAAPSAWSDPPADRGNRGHEDRAEQGHQGPPPERGMGSDRGDHRRGPAPQASVQAPPSRGDQNRGFDRGPAPQASAQAPPNHGGDN